MTPKIRKPHQIGQTKFQDVRRVLQRDQHIGVQQEAQPLRHWFPYVLPAKEGFSTIMGQLYAHQLVDFGSFFAILLNSSNAASNSSAISLAMTSGGGSASVSVRL